MIGYCKSEECNLMVEASRNKSDWQAMNNQAYSSRQIDKDSMPQGFLGDYRLDAYIHQINKK